jgi:hypothetical protein
MLDSSTLEIEQSLVASSEERHRLEAECKREKELLHSALQHTIGTVTTLEPSNNDHHVAGNLIQLSCIQCKVIILIQWVLRAIDTPVSFPTNTSTSPYTFMT